MRRIPRNRAAVGRQVTLAESLASEHVPAVRAIVVDSPVWTN